MNQEEYDINVAIFSLNEAMAPLVAFMKREEEIEERRKIRAMQFCYVPEGNSEEENFRKEQINQKHFHKQHR